MRKRIISALLIASMGLSVVACGKTENTPTEPTTNLEEILVETSNANEWEIWTVERLEESFPIDCTITEVMDNYTLSITYCDNNMSTNYVSFDENNDVYASFDMMTIGFDMYAHCYAEGADTYMHATLIGNEPLVTVDENYQNIAPEDIITICYGGEIEDYVRVNTTEINDEGGVSNYTYVIDKKTRLVNTFIDEDTGRTLYIEPVDKINPYEGVEYDETTVESILWELVAWMLVYTSQDDGSIVYGDADTSVIDAQVNE